MELLIDNYHISVDIEDILEELQRELLNGKLRNFKQTSSGIRVPCPVHSDGKENHESCYISKDGVWHCFTCGASGTIVSFIAACFDADNQFANKWLIHHFGTEVIYEKPVNFCDFDFIEAKAAPETGIDESILDSFQSWHPYMNKRKLSKKVCEEFKVKYDPKSECLVFPVWDETDRLYMLTRRSVKNKMFLIDSAKEKPVYLLNYINKNNIKEVTVCESQINTLTLWSLGIPSVALFGTGTKHQYELLNKSGIRHYYLAFDGDDAGRKGIRRFIANIRKDVFIDIMILPDKKDINDLTEDEFNKLEILEKDEWLLRYGCE